MTRAAVWCVKFDVHRGQHKPRMSVEAVIPDPLSRDGVFATEDNICGCGDDVAAAGYADMFTSGICVQLPTCQLARGEIFVLNEKKAATSPAHPQGVS